MSASSEPRASEGALRVLSTLALAKAMRELVSRYEHLTGTRASVDFASTNELLHRIRSGQAADVAILTAEAIARLIEAGVLVRGSEVDLALSFVGLAVRAGSPKPDIGSVRALTSALLRAESIVYSKVGASGQFFAALIQKLGIAEEINAKARIIPTGFTAELVAAGEAELAVQQISELMAVPGVDVVARLPAEVESGTMLSAGIFRGSDARKASVRLLELLSSSESAPVVRASGLEPVQRSTEIPTSQS